MKHTYDGLNRLTKVEFTDGTAITYTYDAAGNRLTETVDTVAPSVAIELPTAASAYNTSVAALDFAGTATDDIAVAEVTWTNDRGGSGTAVGTTTWSILGISLQLGANLITVTAHDAVGKIGTDTLTVTLEPATPTVTATETPTNTPVPTDTPTNTPLPTNTAVPTNTPTETPTITPGTHDSVVLPVRPVNILLRATTSAVTKKLQVRVKNADPTTEVPADTIHLTATSADCPALDIGTPNFNPPTRPPSDTVVLGGGRSNIAVVPLTIHANDFLIHNGKAPKRCVITLTSSTDLMGNTNVDPTPENNSVTVEVNVIDKHVAESTTTHESVIKSIAPVSVSIPKPPATVPVVKTVRPVVLNADLADVDPGHNIGLTVESISCAWVSVVPGSLDIDRSTTGAQDNVTLKAGRASTGSIKFNIASSVATENPLSPARCKVVVRASTNVTDNVEPDDSNNTTTLTIDAIDKNDF